MTNQYHELLTQAEEYLSKQDYERSTSFYEYAIEEIPFYTEDTEKQEQERYDNLDKMFNIGTILFDQKYLTRAVKSYRKVLAIDPSYRPAYYGIGNVYFTLHKYPEATNNYYKACNISDDYDNDRFKWSKIASYEKINHIGNIYIENKEYHKFLNLYIGLYIEIDEENILERICDLGTTLYQNGDHKNAIFLYEELNQIAPHYERAIIELGNIYFQIGQEETATEKFETFFDTFGEGDDAWALDKLRESVTRLSQKKNYVKSIQICEKILDYTRRKAREEDNNTIYIESLHDIAKLYDDSQQFDQALERYLEIMEEFSKEYHGDARKKIDEIYRKTIAEKENERRKQAEEAKSKIQNMIAQYTHTLGNTLFPNQISNVIATLRKHREFKKEVILLEKSYQAEVFIKRQGQLLALKNTERQGQSFRALFRTGCLLKEAKGDFTTITDILNWAAERVLTRFFSNNISQIQNLLEQKHGVTLMQWKQDFEENVVFSQTIKAVNWASKHLANVNLHITPIWQGIKMKPGEDTEIILFGYLSELLLNALKYHDSKYNEWVTIHFDEEEEYLTILCENPYNPQKKKMIDSVGGKGLESIRNDLEMLNQHHAEAKTLVITTDNNLFQVKLYFARDLLEDDTQQETFESTNKFFGQGERQ